MILETCRKYEKVQPKLWIKALELVASFLTLDHEKAREILMQVNRLELLGPLEIIKILSRNRNSTLGIVKDFVVETIVKERKSIEEVCFKFRIEK